MVPCRSTPGNVSSPPYAWNARSMAWTAPSSRRRSRKAIDWNVLDQTRPSVLGHILSTNKLQSEGPSAALGTVQGRWGPIHAHPKTQAICHNSRFDLHPVLRTQQAQPLVHHYTHTVPLSLVTCSEPRYISLARHPNTQLSVLNQPRSKTISYNLSCNYDNHRHKLELFSLKPSWSSSSASLLLTLDFHDISTFRCSNPLSFNQNNTNHLHHVKPIMLLSPTCSRFRGPHSSCVVIEMRHSRSGSSRVHPDRGLA